MMLITWWVVALSGCIPASDSISTIEKNDSNAPCWFEICPGSTSKEDAIRLLTANDKVLSDTILVREFDSDNNFIVWEFESKISDFGRVYYADGTVNNVRIWPNGTISLGDIVSIYGTPTEIFTFSDCADSRWLYIAAIYPHEGVYVIFFDDNWQREEIPELSAETPVTEVIYYPPTQLEDLMMRVEGANWPGVNYSEIVKNLRPWGGFGPVEVLRACF